VRYDGVVVVATYPLAILILLIYDNRLLRQELLIRLVRQCFAALDEEVLPLVALVLRQMQRRRLMFSLLL
jgi:hypothetical protein